MKLREYLQQLTRRDVLRGIVLLIVGVLFTRLLQLQIVYRQEFGKKSFENSVRMIVREPIRGYMLDRNGKMIVDVGPSYSIMVTPIEFDRKKLPLLASLLNMEPPMLEERFNKGKSFSAFQPVRIARDVNFEVLAGIEEHLTMLNGVTFQVESKRVYRSSMRGAHLLGYVKEISDQQLSKLRNFYQHGDMIGSSGIEAGYEPFLRGQKGFSFVAVNAQGQTLGPVENGRYDIPSKEGYDLMLALDLDLQVYAESLMTNKRGAIVAMDPNDGGILALVSKPDYDPAVFSGMTRAEDWNALNTDESKPLFNRATLTRYPPGSTFKMVLAAAALEEGIIDENTTIGCTGVFYLGNHPFKDLHVHGTTNVVKAIQQSCNVFFYRLILKVGLDKWNEYARKFGFGSPTGFDIGEETSGLLPSTAYYDRVYGSGKWTQGYTVSLSVGQGELGVSPLQMVSYAGALANGTTLHQPHAVRFIMNKTTNRYEPVEHRSTPLGISKRTMDLIREGMRRVVQEAGGTGGGARIAGIESAGKTGTAQNPHGKDHAWYIGFAPFDNPKIAVVVMLENAGFGGAASAPLAKLVIQKYLASIQAGPAAVAASADTTGTGTMTEAMMH